MVGCKVEEELPPLVEGERGDRDEGKVRVLELVVQVLAEPREDEGDARERDEEQKQFLHARCIPQPKPLEVVEKDDGRRLVECALKRVLDDFFPPEPLKADAEQFALELADVVDGATAHDDLPLAGVDVLQRLARKARLANPMLAVNEQRLVVERAAQELEAVRATEERNGRRLGRVERHAPSGTVAGQR